MSKRTVEISHLMERVKEKPVNYPVCISMTCGRRESCLHALETTAEGLECPVITCINPLKYRGKDGCSEYRDKDAKWQYAFGMKCIAHMLKRLGVYQDFMEKCMRHFCRTVYYDMHAGNRIIYPHEQQLILGCAAEVGVDLPADSFDRMEDAKAW